MWESPASGFVFAEAHLLSTMVLRDCHVGLRPPRNDKFGSIVRSAMPPYNLPARRALAERRYRRNWFIPL